MSNFEFTGAMTALVTPMFESGEIDLESWQRLIEWQLAQGIDGIVVAGTTGEGVALTVDEYAALLQRARRIVPRHMLLIAGAGGAATATVLPYAQAAAEYGADGLLTVTPFYLKTSLRGLEAHFAALADACELPLILYNVPGRTAIDLEPEDTARLCRALPIAAVKEASTVDGRIAALVRQLPAHVNVLSGDDPSLLSALKAGAKGIISVTSNLAPAAVSALVAAGRAAHWDEAAAIDADLQALHHALFIEPNPIPVKWALAHCGLIASGLRLPLVPLGDTAVEQLLPVLQQSRRNRAAVPLD